MYVALGGLTGPAIAVAMVEKRSGQRKGRFSGSGRGGVETQCAMRCFQLVDWASVSRAECES